MSLQIYDKVEETIKKCKNARILVVIPSRNASATIGYVLKTVDQGLQKYYPESSSGIIIVDGLSKDTTVEIARIISKELSSPASIIPNTLSPGKGGAMKIGIDLAYRIGAEILVFVDSDLRSITPEWIALLGKAAEKCGYATPYYIRDRFDATITSFVARPLTVMAYGLNIRQPIGGDFGLGRKLIECLAEEAPWFSIYWNLLFGVDIFITHTALSMDITPCEADLKAKLHEAKDPSKSLVNMFVEVTGSLYNALLEYADKWVSRNVVEIRDLELIKEPEVPEMMPARVKVDPGSTFKKFSTIFSANREFISKFLPDNLVLEIQHSISRGAGIDREEWREILFYGFKFFADNPRYIMRRRLLETLMGLWLGRLYNYYYDAVKMSDRYVEEYLALESTNVFRLRNRFIEVAKKYIA